MIFQSPVPLFFSQMHWNLHNRGERPRSRHCTANINGSIIIFFVNFIRSLLTSDSIYSPNTVVNKLSFRFLFFFSVCYISRERKVP